MFNNVSFFQYIAQSNVINFLLMIAVLYWIISKLNLNSSFEKSIENVVLSIKQSDEAKNNSVKQLQNTKSEMKKLPAELKKMEDDTEEKSQSLKNQIEISTQKSLNNIKLSVSKVLDIEKKKIQNEIFNQTIKKSVLTAEDKIINLLKSNPDLHYKFIEDSLEELDKVKI